MKDNRKEKNILEVYRNYLFALQEREEYKDRYGDTDELIKIYESKLSEYSIKLVKK